MCWAGLHEPPAAHRIIHVIRVNRCVCQFVIAVGDHTERYAQVSPEDLQRLERRIRSINSMAQIQHTQKADVPVEYVLGIEGFDSTRVDAEVRLFFLSCHVMSVAMALLTGGPLLFCLHACALRMLCYEPNTVVRVRVQLAWL